MNETMARLTELMKEVFEDDDLVVTRDLTADDVDNWDSVMNITLLLEIEGEFGIQFTSSEVASLKNVGELLDLIVARS